MKGMIKILTVLYVLFPLVVIPVFAAKSNNWYYLFGIAFYYLGVILVAAQQKIIFMIPLIFCGWFWLTYGFSLHNFVFFLFIWMVFGALFYMLTDNVKRFVNRTLPENKEALNYDLKMKKMNDKIEEYKQNNPSIKITPEIMDTIRNEVFFNDVTVEKT